MMVNRLIYAKCVMKFLEKRILLDNFHGANVLQSQMYHLVFHKIMNGYYVMQNLINL